MDILEQFQKFNALLEGHFLLSSGRHSNRYLQAAVVLQHPAMADAIGARMAALFPGRIDVVVSPAIGGIVIGQAVGRAKGCRAIFAEKDDKGNPLLRRGFGIQPGENILVVEDVITTGLSTGEVADMAMKMGGDIVGIAAIVSRSEKGLQNLRKYNKPVKTLVNVEISTWESENCPLCKDGVPVVKPGSRKT